MINEYAKKQIENIAVKCKEIKPLVAIRCITYNHELYLKDALEGFIMQKTDFHFIAVVHEDASTDGTAKILKEYAEKYPDIIFPIFEKENQYSKQDGSLKKIMNFACNASGAKYVAICEGDDYWIDPLKLQKQVDFLESHQEYSMCFHNVYVEGNKNINIHIFDHLKTGEWQLQDFIKKTTIPTCSALLKLSIFDKVPVNKNFQMGDNVIWLTSYREGKIYCINEKMGIYRRHVGGYTMEKSNILLQKNLKHVYALEESFPEVKKYLKELKIYHFNCLAFVYLKMRDSKWHTYLLKSLNTNPFIFIRVCFRMLKNKLS